jgi:hypothetical protein
MSASNMAADTPAQTWRMVSSAIRQLRGSGSPVSHMAGESVREVVWRKATMRLATPSFSTSGNSKVTDDTSVGSASEAMRAVIQIHRVPRRLSRAARSARNAPSDSSSDTMIT